MRVTVGFKTRLLAITRVMAIVAAVALAGAACGTGTADRTASPAPPATSATAGVATPTARATASDVATPTSGAGAGEATVSTVLPATVVTPPTPGPPTPTAAPIVSPETVTLDDDGAVLEMLMGERFLLNLGDDVYDWEVEIADPSVLGRVLNITVVKGAQGVYEARGAGRTTLTATGDPKCRRSMPACAIPSRLFQIAVVVR